MGEFHLLYYLTSALIRAYKWIEYKFFQTFSTQLEGKVRGAYRKVGINFFGSGLKQKLRPDSDPNRNGKERNAWDINLHNNLFFLRTANHASLGLGEAYMEGWWDSEDIIELSYRVLRGNLYMEYLNPWNRFLNWLELCFFNLQSKGRAFEVGRKHYDIGNDLFESFLDPWMNYSCGYWAKAKNLEEAQLDKMELIAQKLKLKPGMRVLDIGCGWGGLCKYLAEKHGVQTVGITISVEGVKYAEEKCKGLPCDFRLMDYRDMNEKFDRVVSVGMFEHVGRHNYRTFFEVVNRCLTPDGILLLHTIGNNDKTMPGIEPFFNKYIFPNGYLPYYRDITEYTDGLFCLEDWHNFGHDYSKTLMAWRDNFHRNWHKISHKYGERFYRMWTYYLCSSAGGFRARKVQLWQIVLSKNGLEGGYRSVR